jgi:hypothetical protein
MTLFDNQGRFVPAPIRGIFLIRGAGIASLNSRANLLKPNSLQQDTTYELPRRWRENDETVFWKQQPYD